MGSYAQPDLMPGYLEMMKIVERCFPGHQLVNATRMRGGLFNTTLLLLLNDKRRYILRISPPLHIFTTEQEKKMVFSNQAASAVLIRNNIPTPEIHAADDTILEDRAFLILDYVQGKSLATIRNELDETEAAYTEMGKYTKKLHSITGDSFGSAYQVSTGTGFHTWREAMLNMVYSWKEKTLRHQVQTATFCERVRMVFEEYAYVFDEIRVPQLVHGDLWEGNVLFKKTDGLTAFAGFIDLDQALFGDPEFDFPAGYMFHNGFRSGYGKEPAADRNAVIRRKLYLLLYAMEHYYIWAYLQRNVSEASDQMRTIIRLMRELTMEEADRSGG